jgi:predicted AAA+ superfamily ATPase
MPEIVAITGVRRCGKSTLILQLIEHLIQSGVEPKNTLYVNFEDPNFSGELDYHFPEKIFDAYLEFYQPKGKVYLFLDEIQMVPGWENFVASLYDRKENIKIFVTGSSSGLLMGEISSLLAGRYISEVIYPFSFGEFLDYKGVEYSPLIKSAKIYGLLREYLEFGGFPRVVIEKGKYEKKVILTEYFNSIVERDVLLRNMIKNAKETKEIINFILSNVSCQISSYKLEKMMGVSSQSIRRYFGYFEESFLIRFAPLFDYSVKRQIYNPQKVFAIDSGLANAVSFRFSQDTGQMLENLIAVELLRRGREIYYWEDEREVDFLLREGHKVSELINVCYSISQENLKREVASIQAGMKKFQGAAGKIVYWEGRPPSEKNGVEYINILDFLLNN